MLDTLRNVTIEPDAIAVPDEPHSDYERVRRIITTNEMKAGRDPLGRANDPDRAAGDQGGASNSNRNREDDL